jgi:hypothetical protein
MPGVRVVVAVPVEQLTNEVLEAAGVKGWLDVDPATGVRCIFMEDADSVMVEAAEKLAGQPPRQPIDPTKVPWFPNQDRQ